MKKILLALMVAFAATACYDDAELLGRVDAVDGKVSSIEQRLDKVEKDLAALQGDVNAMSEIAAALQKGLYIKSVAPLSDGTGYTITFSDDKNIVIRNGADGKDGQNGKDGVTPQIVVSVITVDGKLVWAVNGEPLKNGDKYVEVYATTPVFQINETTKKLEVSYDGGASWTEVGDVNITLEGAGENVIVSSIFSDVVVDEDAGTVTITVTEDGSKIVLPLAEVFELVIDRNVVVAADATVVEIPYTVKGETEKTVVDVLAESCAVTVEENVIKVTNFQLPAQFLAFADNGEGKASIKKVVISAESYSVEAVVDIVPAEGGQVTVNGVSNVAFDVVIPEAATWLTQAETKAGEFTLTFNVAENTTTETREAEVKLVRVGTESLLMSFTIAQAPKPFENKIRLAWAYKLADGIKMEALQPAIDINGNAYVTQTGSNKLYKISSDGTLAWQIEMKGSDATTFSGQLSVPSVEKDGSVIYAGGGSSSAAAFYAFNSDGSLKWDFLTSEFWAASGTPAPKINRLAPAVTDKCVYIGNGGTTGTAIAIDKKTGTRVSYVANKADGTGGPAGGCNVGVSISKKGVALFRAGYGAFGVDTDIMENPGDKYQHATFGGFAPFAAQYRDKEQTTNNGNIVCFTLNGEEYFAMYGATSAGMNVIWAPLEKGDGLKSYTDNTANWTTHKIAGAQKQDQGGMVVGPQNELIVSLKHNATVPGGVYAIDPATNTMAWKYETGVEVGGAPAVDKEGNVHILDDMGTYYIVKPDYVNKTATLVVKASLFDLYKETGHTFADGDRCKAFTSPIIGPDGRMYNAVYFRDSAKAAILGAVMCLEYDGCTGVGDTSWPLKHGDHTNSGVQLK